MGKNKDKQAKEQVGAMAPQEFDAPMEPAARYPEKRNLDPILFRVKRDDGWETVCLSDLTYDEQVGVLGDRDVAYLTELALVLAGRIRYIGDELDVRASDEPQDEPQEEGLRTAEEDREL